MGRFAHNHVLDGLGERIAGATHQLACVGEPESRSEALSTALASVAMSGGDFSHADGDMSGRKTTMAQKANVEITDTGEGDHVVLIDATRVLYVTVCDPQVLTEGNTITFPAWAVEVADPEAPPEP